MSEGYGSQRELRGKVGFVVPVWFPKGTDPEMRRRLLEITLQDSESLIQPEHICLVNDGDEDSRDIVTDIARGSGHLLVDYPVNRGKEFAVMSGITALLQAHDRLDYVGVRDADGDHFIQDLPNLYRAAREIEDAKGTDRVLMIGCRHDLHLPLGWLRGELEALQNAVLLDSLKFWLAQRQESLDLRFCASYGDLPDFQSGYKLYSAATARPIFTGIQTDRFGPLTDSEFWHYGTESVSIFEGVMNKATLGAMERSTYRGQPVSGFGSFKPESLYSCVMTWIFWRAGVPVLQAAQIFDNHALRLKLWTSYEGRQVLLEVRRIVIERLGGQTLPPPLNLSFL